MLTLRRRPDLYHTCNNLSGLSIAQHHLVHSPKTIAANRSTFDPSKGFPAVKPTTPEGGWKSEDDRQAVRREIWANALGWIESGPEHVVGGKDSRLVSPVPLERGVRSDRADPINNDRTPQRLCSTFWVCGSNHSSTTSTVNHSHIAPVHTYTHTRLLACTLHALPCIVSYGRHFHAAPVRRHSHVRMVWLSWGTGTSHDSTCAGLFVACRSG